MTDISIQSCRLFHTFEDTSSEYKLQKIKYDELEFEKLVNIWCDDLNEKLTCVGFIGDRIHVSIACQHFLESTIEQTQILENLLKEHISLVSECLLGYRKANKIAFIYCCNNLVFQEGPLPPHVVSFYKKNFRICVIKLFHFKNSSLLIMYDTLLICVRKYLFFHLWIYNGI